MMGQLYPVSRSLRLLAYSGCFWSGGAVASIHDTGQRKERSSGGIKKSHCVDSRGTKGPGDLCWGPSSSPALSPRCILYPQSNSSLCGNPTGEGTTYLPGA